MIWSKTIEIGETKTHILMSMSAKDWNINEHQINVHNPPGSTSILRPYYRGYGPSLNEGPTFLSQVCPDAHKAYQNVYSYMSCRTGEGSRLATYFYNTVSTLKGSHSDPQFELPTWRMKWIEVAPLRPTTLFP